ncbi:hypothetical protein F5Y13DRAFT_184785 [Hypoxylon sp. FL1857]|nr:hypothetical protein F5Y13DRAFT_184785 [Hypoxylon sp. FL1857]
MIGYSQSFDSAASLKRMSFTGIVAGLSQSRPRCYMGACLMIAQNTKRLAGGQFGFMAKIGATDAAVATLNDQPYLFTILVVVLVALILQSILIWYIHYATMKPEQKKKKAPKDNKKPGGKPPAAR